MYRQRQDGIHRKLLFSQTFMRRPDPWSAATTLADSGERRVIFNAHAATTGRKELANSTVRRALLCSVSAAAGIFLLPSSAYAQSTTCSQTGTTITCVDGANTVLTASTTPGTNTVPGPGLVIVDMTTPSTTTYTASGPSATTGVF